MNWSLTSKMTATVVAVEAAVTVASGDRGMKHRQVRAETTETDATIIAEVTATVAIMTMIGAVTETVTVMNGVTVTTVRCAMTVLTMRTL